jgi:uncharacterized membrane protein YvlD (DUF360 family)
VWVADLVLPGFVVEYPGGALAFAVVATVISMLAQPLMVGSSVRLGWWGVLLVALVGQAAVVGLAAQLMPRVEVDGFWTAFAVGWIVGGVATLVGWLTTSGTDAAFVSRLVRDARRHQTHVTDPEREGVVYALHHALVQILELLGHRTDLAAAHTRSGGGARPDVAE